MNIAFIGAGKLGLPVSLACANKGHDVMVTDINPLVADILKTKQLPYIEAGAQELLDKTDVKFASLQECVSHGEIIFVPIQTPHNPKFEGTTCITDERVDFDYSFLKAGIRALAEEIERQGNDKVVIIISTVLPGTIEREIKPLLSHHIRLGYSPFFIAMGQTIQDFLNPEFVLFGVDDEVAAESAKAFYKTIHNKPFYETSIPAAELIKVAYNTFIGQKIVFANNLMEICHKMGIDVDDVTNALKLATDRLISPKYLSGGMSDGGGCFAPGTLVQTSDALKSIENVNIGDRVLGHDGRYHMVAEIMKRWYEGEVIRLIPAGFAQFPIVATPEHPIWSAKRKFAGCRNVWGSNSRFTKTINKYDKYKRRTMRLKPFEGHLGLDFRAISELEKGDVLALPVIKESGTPAPKFRYNRHYDEVRQVTLNPDTMYAFGLFLAEGNVWEDEISFAFHEDETELAQQLQVIFGEQFNLVVGDHTTPSRKNTHCLNMRATSAPLSTYLNKTFGKYAWAKHVPYEWLGLSDEMVIPLLRGMWYGDAGSEGNKILFVTASMEIFNFNMLALLKLNVPFHTWVRPAWVAKDGLSHRMSYTISINKTETSAKIFPNLTGDCRSVERRTHWYDDGYQLSFVKDVSRERYSGYVYNLEVEDAYSYCLVGAAVHNCHPRDGIAMSWLAKQLDLSYDWSEAVMVAREKQTAWLADLVQQNYSGLPIWILGTAYKPNTNLTLGSPAILLRNILGERKLGVNTYDPYVDINSHPPLDKPALFFIGTKHAVFEQYKFPADSIVIDPWRFIGKQDGVKLIPVGGTK